MYHNGLPVQFSHILVCSGCLAGLASFCQLAEKKTVFSMVKTRVAKIVFAGKDRFLPE